MARLHYNIRVNGRVQGVFYRASTVDTARRLGVTGWVRNEPDGSVYLEAEGTREQLEELLGWCNQGPTYAAVKSVNFQEDEIVGFLGFGIRR